jgi:molybdopterin-guanine dinucleotide biosynthesis protein B
MGPLPARRYELTVSPAESRRTTPLVHFIGASGSGKTTLLEKVIRRLKERGHRIAAVKHTHHWVELDRPGKDSWRFAAAGADIVTVAAPDRLATFERTERQPGLENLVRSLEGRVDLILAEGFKAEAGAKVLVVGKKSPPEPLPAGEYLAVVSGSERAPSGIRRFSPNDIDGLVTLLEEFAGLSRQG